jgi:hypothetical protein
LIDDLEHYNTRWYGLRGRGVRGYVRRGEIQPSWKPARRLTYGERWCSADDCSKSDSCSSSDACSTSGARPSSGPTARPVDDPRKRKRKSRILPETSTYGQKRIPSVKTNTCEAPRQTTAIPCRHTILMGLMGMGLTDMGLMGPMGRSRQECGLRGIGKRRWAARSCEVFAVGLLDVAFANFSLKG